MIDCENPTRRFGQFTARNCISFSVARRIDFGFDG
jgi:hypothetical protein